MAQISISWHLHTEWADVPIVGVETVAKVLRAEGSDNPDDLPDMALNGTHVTSLIGKPNREVASWVSHYGFMWLVLGVLIVPRERGTIGYPEIDSRCLSGRSRRSVVGGK